MIKHQNARIDTSRPRGSGATGRRDAQLRQPLLRLTLLAPEIVEAILDGRKPNAMQMQLEEVTRAMPSEWEAQRELFC